MLPCRIRGGGGLLPPRHIKTSPAKRQGMGKGLLILTYENSFRARKRIVSAGHTDCSVLSFCTGVIQCVQGVAVSKRIAANACKAAGNGDSL